MRVVRSVAVAVAFGAVLTACSDGTNPSATPSSAPPTSVSPTPTPTPSASPTSVSPSPSPSLSPTPTRTPTRTPSPTPPPGRVLTTAGAYLEVSEDPNLTDPDPENGCEVHDPDLTDISCDVLRMAGGLLTWVSGAERNPLPGQSEPRRVMRIYRRLANGTDEMTHVAFGDPGVWADAEARPASLTGQTRDTLVVIVRFQGSGTMGGYDLLTWRTGTTGPRLRAHHEEGPKARIFVRPNHVATYIADYSDGSPNCCPRAWQYDQVYYDGTSFRLRRLANVSSPPG